MEFDSALTKQAYSAERLTATTNGVKGDTFEGNLFKVKPDQNIVVTISRDN